MGKLDYISVVDPFVHNFVIKIITKEQNQKLSCKNNYGYNIWHDVSL